MAIGIGALHLIANLPPLGLPQENAYTIDENAGKYIFLGSDPAGAACYSTYLYVLDINTGSVISDRFTKKWRFARNIFPQVDTYQRIHHEKEWDTV